MSTGLPSIPAAVLLQGQSLGLDPDEIQIRRKQRKFVRRTPGGPRQQLAWAPPGSPVLQSRRTFALSWIALLGLRDTVERILSHPGPYSLALWRREHLSFAGNGTLQDFTLPWPQAADHVDPLPPGLTSERLATTARVGLSGPQLAVSTQDDAAYTSGSPAPGEVWMRRGTQDFKLGDTLAPGEILYLDLVPLFTVIETDETETTLRGPIAEPRSLVLVEAAS